ncbi:hypothetical protein CHS0354_008618 [Potamilus streckersoni]|uniref:Long-chain-fatty-acid--CoA ligase n=1 Tax=Potamilus streckersoni TaxID=2493646 RepID=A0AAE0SWD0_9BIVA|nr:hypothetical protein CHS0354_008618 [Potamilus streckersoni]
MQHFRDGNQTVLDGLIGPACLTVGAVTVATTVYYLATRPKPMLPPVDLRNQSVLLEDGSRGSWFNKDGKLYELMFEDARTLHEGFKRGLKVSNNGPCLGSRTGSSKEYKWLSYQEVYDRAQAVGSGLILEGQMPRNNTFIGIYSVNRAEWTITEQACSMFSMVTVALYDTLGPDACSYIINQTEMQLVVVDKPEKAQILLDNISTIPSLKILVLLDPASSKNQETAKKHNIKLVQFADLMEEGKKNFRDPIPPKPDDLAMICYTSGTTGDPKGVMLTHMNIISNMSGVALHVEPCIKLLSTDVHLSYLPLAHMFERGMQVLLFMHGAKIGFSQGDIKFLTDDLQTLKPTIFPTVPRLLNRIYDKVLAGVKGSSLKSMLLNWAMASKEREIKQGIIRKDSFWDKIVFGKIQKMLGGNIRCVITGSAPLEDRVLSFCRCAFGCLVLEGYGQTEATAGITFSVPGDAATGQVGPPLPCTFVKLVDVPEMDYYEKDNKGEVCARGPSIFLGYYKNQEKTQEVLDSDGWLHTGDIGMWLPNGTLKIIDRKKNIFKLAQGEYIAAEKIENTYMRSLFVAQCFVEGDSLQPCIMGVIVPDEEVLLKWAGENRLTKDFRQLCASENVKSMILADILQTGKTAKLKGFEQVKDIILHPELFSVENGLLTPTFKNKRPQLRTTFKSQIENLYKAHGSS